MTEKISIEEFQKLDIRVGKIIEVEEHPNASKLYVLKVDLGEIRTIVAGLKPYYSKEELKGKKGIFIANIKPVVIRGIESNGMILAAGYGENVVFLSPEKDIDEGAKIR